MWELLENRLSIDYPECNFRGSRIKYSKFKLDRHRVLHIFKQDCTKLFQVLDHYILHFYRSCDRKGFQRSVFYWRQPNIYLGNPKLREAPPFMRVRIHLQNEKLIRPRGIAVLYFRRYNAFARNDQGDYWLLFEE